jgi:predicted DNA-binding transcriptional regulator YafY
LEILSRLYRSETVEIGRLSEEFDRDRRTIRRDIEQIRRIVPLRGSRGAWRIDLTELDRRYGTLSDVLLRAFAENLRIRSSTLGRQTGDRRIVEYAIKYHRLPKELGERLFHLIRNRRRCSFHYRDKAGRESLRRFAPVKLLSDAGVWYVVGYDYDREEQRIFRLDRIGTLRESDEPLRLSRELLERIETIVNPWQQEGEETITVTVHADNYALPYLESHPLHPSQRIEEPLSEGGAILSYRITHPMELLPRIKSWIPHLTLLEPESMKATLMKELREGMEKIEKWTYG